MSDLINLSERINPEGHVKVKELIYQLENKITIQRTILEM